MVNKSDYVYLICAKRNKSQFQQHIQLVRCKVLEAHRGYLIIESLKRYNQKYSGASKTSTGLYAGMPVRRINKDQVFVILDETTGNVINWETIRRREGASSPGRARGGR